MTERRYNIEFEVISPLHIGAGEENNWLSGVDFVEKNNMVYVLDINKLLEDKTLSGNLQSLFLNGNNNGLANILGSKLNEFKRFEFHLPAETKNEIKSFIRTKLYNKPVVVGSSLKGAIRSALFNYIREGETDLVSVYGSLEHGTDFMRFINVGDILMSSTILVNSKLFNLMKDPDDGEWYGGWKHADKKTNEHYSSNRFNTLYECVKPGTKGAGTIDLKETEYKLLQNKKDVKISHEQKKTMLMEGGINKLFEVINNATKAYLQKEKHFFEYYNTAERTEEIIDFIDNLIDMIPQDNSFCIIKMAAGTGFHSITGNYKFEDFVDTGIWEPDNSNYGKAKYKSRRIAEYNGKLQLMGFAKLRGITKDEAEAINEANLDEPKPIPNKKEIAEREKREQEERAYEELMTEAKCMFESGEWEKAMEKTQQAGKIMPDRKEHTELYNKCKKAKEDKTNEAYNILIEDSVNKFKQPLAEVIKGKTSLGNLLGTTKKWLSKDDHTFGKTEFAALLDAINMLPPKEKKTIKKKKNSILSVIGQEWENELSEKIQ